MFVMIHQIIPAQAILTAISLERSVMGSRLLDVSVKMGSVSTHFIVGPWDFSSSCHVTSARRRIVRMLEPVGGPETAVNLF